MSILELNESATSIARVLGRVDRRITGQPSKLRALVLLGGDLGPSSFAAAIGRSRLDLPVDAHHTVLDLWRAHGAILAAYARTEQLAVRVITNSMRPGGRPQAKSLPVSIESDPFELRGPGGVLRDVAESYADDDVIAVATANQVLFESLPHLLESLEAARGDVSLLAQEDGTPAGLLLARCGALRAIASIGYVDLKEQALPAIARSASVKVVHRRELVAMPVRTLPDYIAAMREYHVRFSAQTNGTGQFVESWSSAFNLCESGSHVDSSARVHDSVVLRGARIERGALVARSVVCPGAVVRRDEVVVDQVVGKAQASQRVW